MLCFDASRLARNGRDWHHLLELCGLVDARVIDLDGVYDPCRPNDRLLLGMKGSISEFELGVHAIADAAMPHGPRPVEVNSRIPVPIGYYLASRDRSRPRSGSPRARGYRRISSASANSGAPAKCIVGVKAERCISRVRQTAG